MSRAEQIQKLQKLTGKSNFEEAVATVEQVLTVASRQNFILSNMGVLTIVYGPTGMGLFTLSPDATQSLEKLAMVEKAVLDFQTSLIQRRQQLLSMQQTLAPHASAGVTQPESPKE